MATPDSVLTPRLRTAIHEIRAAIGAVHGVVTNADDPLRQRAADELSA